MAHSKSRMPSTCSGCPRPRRWPRGISDRQAEIASALPVSGRKPITFLSPTETLATALPDASMQRLRRLKEELDPQQTLRGNFSILG